MRNLKIKRMKSYPGCLTRTKVYIEDHNSPDTKINKIPCRKLGKLKNGEEKIFEIDNNAAKVFVYQDKLSKNFCNDFYPLEEGAEDIALCGKNYYKPFLGNPFLFYGLENNEEVVKNRKRNSKITTIIIVFIFIFVFALGFFGGYNTDLTANAEPKTFSSNGMSITLTNEFEEMEMDGYTVCYGSPDTAVFALKEDFDLAEGFENYTLDEYAGLIIEANGVDPSAEVQHKDGITYFEYEWTDTDSDVTYVYYTTVYKSVDAFWQIQFVADADNYEAFIPQFEEFAKSVQFAG